MKSLRKNYQINTTINKLIDAFTNPTTIEKWSGAIATMDIKAGGSFTLWNGEIWGINHKISDKCIRQEWFAGPWEEASRVIFNLKKQSNSVEIELIHENIPDDAFDSINEGWDDYYMLPIKALLEKIN